MDVREQLKQIQDQIEGAKRLGASFDGTVYSVNGISCSWDLVVDGEKVFQGVERGIGLTKRSDFVNACHELYTSKINQVKAIEEKINNKETRVESMDNTNSMRKTFAELKKVYTDASATSTEVFEKWENAQKEWKNRPLVENEQFYIAKGKYLEAQKEFKDSHSAIVIDVNTRVSELKEKLEKQVEAYYKIRPDKIDNGALELLKLGVYKENDLSQLVNDNRDNPTMLAVISKYASDMNTSESRAIVHNIKQATNSKKELNTFNELCGYGARWYSEDRAERKAVSQYFDSLFDNTISNVSDFNIE